VRDAAFRRRDLGIEHRALPRLGSLRQWIPGIAAERSRAAAERGKGQVCGAGRKPFVPTENVDGPASPAAKGYAAAALETRVRF
jgi:hypothetical protein